MLGFGGSNQIVRAKGNFKHKDSRGKQINLKALRKEGEQKKGFKKLHKGAKPPHKKESSKEDLDREMETYWMKGGNKDLSKCHWLTAQSSSGSTRSWTATSPLRPPRRRRRRLLRLPCELARAISFIRDCP